MTPAGTRSRARCLQRSACMRWLLVLLFALLTSSGGGVASAADPVVWSDHAGHAGDQKK
jgi:hypothetical protein